MSLVLTKVQKCFLVLLVLMVLWPSTVILADSLSNMRGIRTIGGSDTSQWIGGYSQPVVTGGPPGTDPYGSSTSPVWLIVRILPYIFVAIGLLAVLGLIGSGELLAGLILAAIVIVITIVGTILINGAMP